MQQPAITLRVSDERGESEPVTVASTRFSIGSSPDNDLVIESARVSRRHALIETFEGVVQLSDCGSESGTFINGREIKSPVILQDGDRISITAAGDTRICVSIRSKAGKTRSIKDTNRQQGVVGKQNDSGRSRLPTPVLALGAMLLILVVTVSLIAFFTRGSGQKRRVAYVEDNRSGEAKRRLPDQERAADMPVSTPAVDSSSKDVTIEQLEEIAAQVLRRISSDDKPYVFPSYAVGALDDIKQAVDAYAQSPALASTLNSLTVGGSSIAVQARREGIEPGLVIYTALAETDGGRAGSDPSAVARRVLPELLLLRKTLGTELADKSLILIAAYKIGGGTKKSHPLIRTMTRLVKNALTDRNVWYLRQHGGLDDSSYDFIVKFLALGIIAENPRKFGVTASPLAF